MPKKVMVLFAAAGLLVFAFASPRAESPVPAHRHPLRHGRNLDSLRMLRAGTTGTALPHGIDAAKVVRELSRGQNPGTPRRLDGSPFGDEFEPAPNDDGDLENAAVAFADTEYLVVWVDWDSSNIYGARVDTAGNLLDESGFPISNSGAVNYKCAVAFDGTNFLVVWDDYRYDTDIYGARVTQSGSVVPGDEDGILITPNTEGTYEVDPGVAFDGTNYLVVWDDNEYVYGARVSTGGDVQDLNGILISNAANGQYFPKVAFDGTNYIVVWEDKRTNGVAYDIYGARVRPNGLVLDPGDDAIPISIATNDQYYPRVAFDGTNYLVVWQDYRNGTGYDNADIYGARVSQLGSVLDPNGIVISDTTSDEEKYPAVAFDGTDYIVAWDDGSGHVYGCQVSLASPPGVGASYDISGAERYLPALACGPVEGTAMVAYQEAVTTLGKHGGSEQTSPLHARLASFALTGDVGTDRIVRPVASFLEDGSWDIPPAARLTNLGSEPRSFLAKFIINPGNWSSTKIVLGLHPGDAYKRTVEFDPFDLDAAGANLYTAKCTTMLAGDGTKTNDSMSAIFQGCTFINFFDLEDGDLAPAGAWTGDTANRATWTWPPMDSVVWGDQVDGDYDNGENSLLTSPEYTASQANPSIAFQHSYNTTTGNDGGNFSYADNAAYDNWTVLTPTAGQPYTGTVAALGAAGWSGSSSGWLQSVFTIPVTSGTFKVRWRFASDGNDENLPGWLIDEVAGIGCDVGGKLGAAGFIDTMKVWPNPVRGQGQVSYTLRKAGNVTVKLYDASGRLARQVPTSGFKKGRNTATFDATRLARGVYFVKVAGASNFKTTKVIIE